MAAGDDARYLVCAAGAAGVVSCANWFLLRWDEVWGVKSAVSSVGREECSVKFGVWRKQWEVRSVKCGLWSVTFGVRRVQCEVWTVKCEVWSAMSAVWSVKCGVLRVQCEVKCWLRRVQCEVWRLSSVKCDVELQMWHVQHDTSFAECTHARAWLAHGACKFYRWERSYIYIFKATSAPPRAGNTGISSYIIIYHHISSYIIIYPVNVHSII